MWQHKAPSLWSRSLVAVDEDLALGDSVRQDRRLWGDIGACICGMGARSRDRAFESRTAPQLIAGFVNRAIEDVRIQGQDVIGVQVQEREFIPLVGHASGAGVATVVAGENRKRVCMLGDETLSPDADQVAQLVCADEMEASVLQLLNKH